MNAIELDNISFAYGDSKVFEDVSFVIPKNSLCSLVGPNGSGKTTLIKCITGLAKDYEGKISFGDSAARIGYVQQRHFVSEDFPLSVREIVSTGRVTGAKKWFRFSKQDKEIVEHSIESVGLSKYMDSTVGHLSGGQQQRVMIAKAFAAEPEILILDEPIAGVDSESQDLFRETLSHTIDDHETTVLLVSHELSAVLNIVNQVVVLKNKILFDGTPEELSARGISLGVHQHDLPVWLERLEDQ